MATSRPENDQHFPWDSEDEDQPEKSTNKK